MLIIKPKRLLIYSKVFYFLSLGIILGSFIFCTSTKNTRGDISTMSYTPGNGSGFAYKDVSIEAEDFQLWVQENREQIIEVISALEEGYVLEIVGHTDSSGPREAQSDGRKGNVWYSTARAKAVYDALAESGIDPAKLSYAGVADDELLDVSDSTADYNRRVSFRVVQK